MADVRLLVVFYAQMLSAAFRQAICNDRYIDIQRPQAVLPTNVEILQQLQLYVSLFSRPVHRASTCVVL